MVKKALTTEQMKKDIRGMLEKTQSPREAYLFGLRLMCRYSKKYYLDQVLRVMATVILEHADRIEKERKEQVPINLSLTLLGHKSKKRRKAK